MAIDDIVDDPFLRSVLETTTATREQCIRLLDLTHSTESADSESPSTETQLELSRQRKLLSAYLAQLRGLNRKAIQAVRQTKHDTAIARSEVDTLHLQLQNLYYEQRHLHVEISACESYEYAIPIE